MLWQQETESRAKKIKLNLKLHCLNRFQIWKLAFSSPSVHDTMTPGKQPVLRIMWLSESHSLIFLCRHALIYTRSNRFHLFLSERGNHHWPDWTVLIWVYTCSIKVHVWWDKIKSPSFAYKMSNKSEYLSDSFL